MSSGHTRGERNNTRNTTLATVATTVRQKRGAVLPPTGGPGNNDKTPGAQLKNGIIYYELKITSEEAEELSVLFPIMIN